MRKFGVYAAAGPLVCALALGSCGGDGSGNSGNAVSVAAPTLNPAPPPPSPPPPPASGQSALSQADARIGTCINMSNQLEGNPTEGSWGRAIADDDFAQIKAQGFETVRIPVRWSTHAMTAPPYAIDAAWMDRVEEVVNLARASDLRVILNVHHYDEIFDNPDGHRDRLAAFWLQIAERFQNADDMVWFELLNEPHNQITDANLLSILNPALANVRASNPTRPVVVGGENFSGINSLATLSLPDDPYLIATFHYYDPFNFTHQGASFLASPPPFGRVFGSAQDLNEVDTSVAKVQEFMNRTGRPVFMGEYGAIQTVAPGNRALYYQTVTDNFRAADVDGCVWGYISSFNFREDALGGAWDTEMLTAIGL